MCGWFRSLAPHPGAWVRGVLGSRRAARRLAHPPVLKMAPTTPVPSLGLGLGPGPDQNLGKWCISSCSCWKTAGRWLEAVWTFLSVFPVRIPTVAHANTIAVLGHAPSHIGADLAAGPTVENVGEGAIVAHPCLTAADTLATVYVRFLPLCIYACTSQIPTLLHTYLFRFFHFLLLVCIQF